MKTLKSTDAQPDGARITRIEGDVMFCYFDGDVEVAEMDLQDKTEQQRRQRKIAQGERVERIKKIKVTTTAGHVFDGDEASQQRMHRALTTLNNNESIGWVLADNTTAAITRDELHEALRLAFQQQSALHTNQI